MSNIELLNQLKKDFVKSINEEDFDKVNDILDEFEKADVNFTVLKETGLGKVLNNTKKRQASILSLSDGLTERIGNIITKWKNIVDKDLKETKSVKSQATKTENQTRCLIKKTSSVSSSVSLSSPVSISPIPTSPKVTISNYKPSPEENMNVIKSLLSDTSAESSAIKTRILLIKAFADFIKSFKTYEECSKFADNIIQLQLALYEHYNCANMTRSTECSEQLLQLKSGLSSNKILCQKFINGDIDVNKLACLSSEELKSEETKELEKKQEQEFFDSRRTDWAKAHREEINRDAKVDSSEGTFKCPKCHSKNTVYTEKQTRSADEPMTVFVECTDCAYRWRF